MIDNFINSRRTSAGLTLCLIIITPVLIDIFEEYRALDRNAERVFLERVIAQLPVYEISMMLNDSLSEFELNKIVADIHYDGDTAEAEALQKIYIIRWKRAEKKHKAEIETKKRAARIKANLDKDKWSTYDKNMRLKKGIKV